MKHTKTCLVRSAYQTHITPSCISLPCPRWLHHCAVKVAADNASSLQAARESRGSAPDVLTGIAVNGGAASSAATWDAKHTSRMETVARQMESGMGSYALEGHVGDCCDDEEVPSIAKEYNIAAL